MPASQHQKPLSDIEIAQAAKMRPIMDIGRDAELFLGDVENAPLGRGLGDVDIGLR